MKFSGTLNEFDILDLLNEYHSEMRKLKHKVAFVKTKIQDLEDQYKSIKQRADRARALHYKEELQENELIDLTDDDFEEEGDINPRTLKPVKNDKRKAGFKKKEGKIIIEYAKSTGKPKRKPGRKPQALSLWDSLIVDSIIENGKATISRELFERLKEKAIQGGFYESDDKTKIKLNQCLVKLTSKRNDLVKVDYPGRGHAYALPSWVDKRMNLLPEFGIHSSEGI
ncbi:MAG: hypothetical protein CVT92_06300 [Bacteroidetes bacterium HGW-Bacteroidetes-1]|jgi:hypothetical protein|nr:MAG: hypothetical protein CVT92_06300 [Bacteroidetes bacterium HGW-Bacteroidetes-1]